jgi:hypothetical protein
MSEVGHRKLLSGSTDGRQIKVAATGTAGTLIHTASSLDNTNHDEVWLWACNHHSANATLTIEWGGVTDPDDLVKKVIAPDIGMLQIIPGWILTNGLVVRAFSSVADQVTIGGWVCRMPVNPNLGYRV